MQTLDRATTHRLPESPAAKWINADALGILAAVVCVLHCLALPVMAMALPALALGCGQEDLTHHVLAAFVVAFCLFAIVPGYRRHHNNEVLAGMIIGLSLVLFATFIAEPCLGELWEMPLITVGNLAVVVTHLRNRKLLSASRCC